MPYPKQAELEDAVLRIISEAGGKSELQHIYEKMNIRFEEELTAEELLRLNKSGDNTWRNKIRWVRENLIPKGDLIGPEEGVWQITQKGLQRIGVIPNIVDGFDGKSSQTERNGVTHRNTDSFFRRGGDTILVSQKHNQLQITLFKKLCEEYGEASVQMEKNYVDITVHSAERVIFYEVKPYQSVQYCIREGLGQVISYASFDETHSAKKIVIAGPSAPNVEDLNLIKFISSVISIEFEYIQIVDISEVS